MTLYYVDSATGNDGNNGLSLVTAKATIAGAQSLVAAGDTVYILPGVGYGGGTGGGSVLVASTPGTAGNPITYSNFPGSAMPVITSKQGNEVITLKAAYLTFIGLELAGPTITLAGAWINASLASPTADPLYAGDGFSVASDPPDTATNALTAVGNNVLHFATDPRTWSPPAQVGAAALDVTSGHTLFIPAGTTVTAFGGSGSAWTATLTANVVTTQVSSGDLIRFINPVHHITIQGCRIHDFPKSGTTIFQKDYVNIIGNIFYNNAFYSPVGGSALSIGMSVDFDTATTTKFNIIGNVFYGNQNLIGNTFVDATMTTSATTPSGTTLTFASSPASAGVSVGFQVYDVTTPTLIAAGTTVTVVGALTVTLSLAVTGSLASGHTIHFTEITDGEGIIVDTNQGTATSNRPYNGRTLIQNNLCFGNGSSGIMAFHSSHVDAAFNTCYLNQQTPYRATTAFVGEFNNEGAIDCNFYNNIMQTAVANKLFVDRQTSTNAFSTELGFGGDGTALPGSGNTTGDPLFLAPSLTPPVLGLPPFSSYFTGFGLKSGSPAINAASPTYTRATDILGNPGGFGGVSDIGAFEFILWAALTGGGGQHAVVNQIQMIGY